jgi:hypothetical protein
MHRQFAETSSLENQTTTLRMPTLQVGFYFQEEEVLPRLRDSPTNWVRHRLRRRPQSSQVLLDVGPS